MYETDDQRQAEHVRLMGEPLGIVFDALYVELVWLNVKWAEYIELFGTDRERVDLLNRAAPNFFGIIQQVLFEHIVLAVARLTDPVRSLGKENLTVRELPDLVRSEIKGSVQKVVEDAKAQTEFCRQWRHQHIAHKDRALALELAHANPLPDATRQKLRMALRSVADILNTVLEGYGCAPTSFEHTIPALGGAGSLLDVLDSGITGRT
jgi:hypothetical protein